MKESPLCAKKNQHTGADEFWYMSKFSDGHVPCKTLAPSERVSQFVYTENDSAYKHRMFKSVLELSSYCSSIDRGSTFESKSGLNCREITDATEVDGKIDERTGSQIDFLSVTNKLID